jgi:eukaryotic-like serine/threonine-protein kinase
MVGRTLGHYRIESKLGEGGMGVVYRAFDRHLDRPVAIKLLRGDAVADPERRRRFAQEARAASALDHPNILTIHDINRADVDGHAVDFIVMEFIDGHTLDQLIGRKGLPVPDALQYAIQVAGALACAHAAGIVHRDLKPNNIIAGGSGHVKVLDFGLAKLTEHGGSDETARTETIRESPKTGEGMIVGTASYMSPEQAEGRKVDARSDIFSFGALLYEMVTGRRAFSGSTMVSTLSSILRDEPEPVTKIAPGAPRELDRILSRCLQKDPNRRYQHAGDLKLDLERVKEEPVAMREKPSPASRRSWWWWSVVTAGAMAIGIAAGWWLRTPPESNWTFARLTADNGLSYAPALSPDGKLAAYSSDRSGDGKQDLYIQQVAGGQAIRLTTDGLGNTSPDFSPDGTKIVYRSDKDGGGIYEMPAFGGNTRLLARDGVDPKYSPDGSRVAYWIGGSGVNPAVPGSGTVWVLSLNGGPSKQIGASNFTAARSPIWSPDGGRLLVVGYASTRVYDNAGIDWWIVSPDTGDAIQTGVHNAMVRAKIWGPVSAGSAPPGPECWSAGNSIVFSEPSGDAGNLWQLGISPRTGKFTGILHRLTTGAGEERQASCAAGAIAFTSFQFKRNIWTAAFDLNRAAGTGPVQPITEGLAARDYPSLSASGRYVVFSSAQSGQRNIWRCDLTTGRELPVASSPLAQRFPISNPSGGRIAYGVVDGTKRMIYVSTPGGTPEKLCEGCLRATDWSRDEKSLLVFGGNPYQINLLDLASYRQTPLVMPTTGRPPNHVLWAKFSPDDRWISFTHRVQQNRGRIIVTPIDGPKPIPESAWILITEETAGDWAEWSPDGNTLYFPSRRDGHNCFWAQRLAPNTRRPVGEAFAVLHLHGRVTYPPDGSWSAAGGRIAMALLESTGNIWIMSRR